MKNKHHSSTSVRLFTAIALTAAGLALSFMSHGAAHIAGAGLLLAATLMTALPIAKSALTALRYKVVSIDLLVTIAVIGAVAIGEYWEAAIVAVLFSLGHYLEARSINKTRSAIKSLLNEAPDVAWVKRKGKLIQVSPAEVQMGDTVAVKSGQKIPVDGTVIEGQASVNQATVTGESMPVDRSKADFVYAGSIITSGYVTISAEKVGESTLFARILEMVEEAQDKKAKTQVFLERFAGYYTPAIIILAAITYVISGDLYLALTLLVIACPGALVIATPISIVAGIGNGARNGLLIKGGESIENINASTVIMFDKTGTLTEGQPRVVAVKTFGVTKSELLTLAAAAEQYSEHPLGASVVEHAVKATTGDLPTPTNTEVLTGLGVRATVTSATVLVGNRKLLQDSGVTLSKAVEKYMHAQEQAGRTALLVAKNTSVIGVISVADPIRPGAAALIKKLHAAGKTTAMLTGDNRRTAKAVARQLGIKTVYAELLPEGKVAHITKLQKQGNTVTMVGDGVNDAPALATANASVATGGIGKDIAMEVADIVLLSGDIRKLAYALSLSRAIMRNIKTNIAFAVSLVAVLLVGVLTKNVIMSFGMLIHVLSVLLVIMNASRLLRYTGK